MTFDLSSISSLLQSQGTSSSGNSGRIDPRTRDLTLLQSAGATSEQLSAITDRASAEALASELGITLPAMPAPPQGQSSSGSIFDGEVSENSNFDSVSGERPPMGPPPEVLSALQAAGATDEELAGITDPTSAKTLADKYGVDLPEPPAHGKMQSQQSSDNSNIIATILQLLGINVSQS